MDCIAHRCVHWMLPLVLGVSIVAPRGQLLGQASAAAPDPIEGRWTGTVTAPQGTVAEIGFDFYRTPRETLTFRLNFPAMFTFATSLGIPVETGGDGDYAITPAFDIRLHLNGDQLVGTFSQGRLPLRLRRGGDFTPPPPPPNYPPAPTPLWTHKLGAPAWAPPVVAGDMIYVGTVDGRFHAVRAVDGVEAWVWRGENRIDGGATVTDAAIYFIDGRMDLIALDRASGTLRWRFPLHDAVLAGQPVPDNPTFNHRAAIPLLHDGVVYVGSSDGGLYAVEAVTGTRLWRHEARAPIYSGVGLREQDMLMFGTMDGSAVVLDRRTRTETLRIKTGGGIMTTPLVAGDRLIVGSRDYLLYGFNVSDGSLAWKHSYWFSWVESTPVLHDGLIYVGASDYSRVTALDPHTGAAKWVTAVHGMNWGSPLIAGDRVFTGTVAQNIPGTVIKHTGSLLALDRATGQVRWRLLLPPPPEGQFGGFAGTLSLAGDQVIAAGLDGTLMALPAK